MIVGSNWQLLYTSHPKLLECDGMNYDYYTKDMIQWLIFNPSFYPLQKFVTNRGYSAYGYTCKRIYRILAHVMVLLHFVYNFSLWKLKKYVIKNNFLYFIFKNNTVKQFIKK
jgi:hypothetical protein